MVYKIINVTVAFPFVIDQRPKFTKAKDESSSYKKKLINFIRILHTEKIYVPKIYTMYTFVYYFTTLP